MRGRVPSHKSPLVAITGARKPNGDHGPRRNFSSGQAAFWGQSKVRYHRNRDLSLWKLEGWTETGMDHGITTCKFYSLESVTNIRVCRVAL